MSASAFDLRCGNGSFRSVGANFPIATVSSASNFVNSTTMGTEQITGMSSRRPWWQTIHRPQDHIHRKTFLQSVELLDRVCPSGCNTCRCRHSNAESDPGHHVYHIAWMRFLRMVVLARSAINFFIRKNSSSLPASKPCESWKTSLSLLRNISSFSMSWIPRWWRSITTRSGSKDSRMTLTSLVPSTCDGLI